MTTTDCNLSSSPEACCCKFQPWLVVMSASLFFFYIFVQMNIFNAISPALIKEFNFSAVQLGNLAAYYFYGNVIFLIPAGILLDRFSVRKLLIHVVALCIISTYIFSVAHDLTTLSLARLGIGLTGAFCFLPCIKLASRWFQPNRLALVVGLVVTMAMLGGMVAQTPFTLLTDHFGWRNAVLVGAGLGIFCLLAIIIFVRDYPASMLQKAKRDASATCCASTDSAAPAATISFWRSLWMVLKNSQNWLAGIYISFINLPVLVLGGTWGALYLVQGHNLSRESASYVTSMLFLGMIIGSPLAGWISDKMGVRRPPMIAGILLSLLLMLAIVYTPGLSLSVLLVGFLILGILLGAQVIGYPVVTESNHPELTATANALSSTLIMAGGTLSPVFGWLLEMKWDHKIVDGVSVYSACDYQLAMMMFIVTLVIGFIAAVLLKETRCRNITIADNTAENK